jgi:mRNA interferase HigB
MRVVSHKKLVDFYTTNAQSKTALELWYSKISKREISNLNELKLAFSTVDYIGNDRVVFNIKGNDYRLIAIIKYASRKVYVRFVGTHAEYNKIDCKNI